MPPTENLWQACPTISRTYVISTKELRECSQYEIYNKREYNQCFKTDEKHLSYWSSFKRLNYGELPATHSFSIGNVLREGSRQENAYIQDGVDQWSRLCFNRFDVNPAQLIQKKIFTHRILRPMCNVWIRHLRRTLPGPDDGYHWN